MTAPFQLTGCRLSGSRLLSGPPNTYDQLYALAGQVPAFDLRFDRGSIVDVINGIRPTFTRPSSTKLVWNGSQLVPFAADVPAFQVDPLTRRLGYLHEPSATNQVRNNSMVGAAAGTPGILPTNWSQNNNNGLAWNVVGTGTESGINYIDLRVNGTSSGAGQLNLFCEGNVAAVTAQQWSTSKFVRLVSGSLTGISAIQYVIDERTAADAFVTNKAVTILPAITAGPLATDRIVFSPVLNGGGTVANIRDRVQLDCPASTAIDLTIRIGLPQLELGPVATSPIITSGSAVTRAADTMTVSGVDFSRWHNQLGGVTYVEFSRTAFATARFPQIFKFRNGADTDNCETFMLDFANRFSLGVRSGGASQTAFNQSADAAAGSIHRIAARLEVNNALISLNGATSGLDTSVALPVGMDRLEVGGNALGQLLLHRLAYFPPGPAQSRIQQMTL